MGGWPSLSRRALLGTALAWAIGRPGRVAGEVDARKGSFTARAAILYGAFRFEESGVIDERIDRAGGSYEVRISGRGQEMTTDLESTGTFRDGRWAPLRFTDRFVVYGRESRLEITHDYTRRVIQYHGRSETFLLRRIRTTDDTVAVPAGVHVDDVVSATLNHAEGRWTPEADGWLVTHVVRRRRTRASARTTRSVATGRRSCRSRSRSERRGRPRHGGAGPDAVLVVGAGGRAGADRFGANRRPETITATQSRNQPDDPDRVGAGRRLVGRRSALRGWRGRQGA